MVVDISQGYQRYTRDQLITFLSWEDQLFSNKSLDANQKLIIRRQRLVEHHERPRDIKGQSLFRWDIERTAEDLGISSSTVSRKVSALEDSNIIARVEAPYVKKN